MATAAAAAVPLPATTTAATAAPKNMSSTSGQDGVSAGNDIQLRNRLSESKSPYVREHAENPVAWQMWNEETLALAKTSQRLIFLSVGYSACHWCHVMNRESFTHPSIAALLNKHFIPIKLDREERPDIDRVYMNYVQATTGGGGWPLNVFLTPDLEPLFGGTYWPGPDSTMRHAGGVGQGATTGFKDILTKLADVWLNQRARCVESATLISRQLEEFAREGMIGRDGGPGGGQAEGLDLEHLDEAYEHFRTKFDESNAGFGSAPKFPTPVNLRFLLALGAWRDPAVRDVVGDEECEDARRMAVRTLRAIWRGGIKDQVGHGVARYSVTRDWGLPHFEKMLYDNAQLLSAYTDAWLVTQQGEGKQEKETETETISDLKAAVVDIATYLTTPPISLPDGGFCSSEDADSLAHPNDADKREGAFYVWTLGELRTLLGERDASVAARYWGAKENGNVAAEHDAHDELMEQNVLQIQASPAELGKEFGLAVAEVQEILKAAAEKLRKFREESRPRPTLDDKVVVAFNGLAIGALARAGVAVTVMGGADAESKMGSAWIGAAAKAATFIRKELWDSDAKVLYRVWREGRGDVTAFADDYAFLIAGLIDLYEATWDDGWLAWADELQKTQLALFGDTSSPSPGGFYSTLPRDRAPDLLLRLKDGMDNAEPSTNGISALNLNRLAALLSDDSYKAAAAATVDAFEAEVMQHPFLFPSLLTSVVIERLGMTSLQVVGSGAETAEVVKRIGRKSRPDVAVVRIGGDDADSVKSEWLRSRNVLLKDVKAGEGGKVKVLACEEGRCRELSTEELEAL